MPDDTTKSVCTAGEQTRRGSQPVESAPLTVQSSGAPDVGSREQSGAGFPASHDVGSASNRPAEQPTSGQGPEWDRGQADRGQNTSRVSALECLWPGSASNRPEQPTSGQGPEVDGCQAAPVAQRAMAICVTDTRPCTMSKHPACLP